jgi:cell wall-associated NlpC family hydrolase
VLLALCVLLAAVSAAITLALGAVLSSAASTSHRAAGASDTAVPGPGAVPPEPAALADIPGDYLRLYQQAAHGCPGLSWAVLAAIGKIESNHGRSTLPGVAPGTVNSAGAGGPMQFLAPTFAGVIAKHAIPPGGHNPPSRYDPHDAIWAAAFYLCDNGARNGTNINAALWTYNHSQTYINQVLTQANQYSETTPNTSVTCGSFQPSFQSGGEGFSSAALVALRFSCAQLGKPYVWGGNGQTGFDCSGLTKAAYAAAGVILPRTADQQFRAGPHLPTNEPLQPGDLVFYGNPSTRITHVALYIGGNQVIQARDVGTLIEVDPLPRAGYAGASRPTAQNGGFR